MKKQTIKTSLIGTTALMLLTSFSAHASSTVKLKPVLFGRQTLYGETTLTAVEACLEYLQFLKDGKVEGLKAVQTKCGAKKNWEDAFSLFGSAAEGATAGAVVELSDQLRIAQSGACNGDVTLPVASCVAGIENPAGRWEPLPDSTSLPVVGTARDPITISQGSMPYLEKALIAQLNHSNSLVGYKCSNGDLLIQTR